MAIAVVCIALLALCSGIFGGSTDTVVKLKPFDSSNFITNCTVGMIGLVDRYILTGTIDTTGENLTERSLVNFDIKQTSLTYTPLCDLYINAACVTNQTKSTCYCKSFVNGLLEVVINKTSETSESSKNVRLSWPAYPVGSPDVSLDNPLPDIYSVVFESLAIDGEPVSLENCQVDIKINKPTSIHWCVSNLMNPILKLSFDTSVETSSNSCVTCNVSTNSSLIITASYVEQDGCQRKSSHYCFLNVQDVTGSQNSTDTTTWATLDISETCSNVCIGIVTAHAVCTVFVILMSIIFIILILNNALSRNQWIVLFLLLFTFETAQLILVIIAGTEITYYGETTLHVWKIMIIYQCATNLLIIAIELVIIFTKSECTSLKFWMRPILFITILISIHSIIGIVAIPFIVFFKCVNPDLNNTPSDSTRPLETFKNGSNERNMRKNKVEATCNLDNFRSIKADSGIKQEFSQPVMPKLHCNESTENKDKTKRKKLNNIKNEGKKKKGETEKAHEFKRSDILESQQWEEKNSAINKVNANFCYTENSEHRRLPPIKN